MSSRKPQQQQQQQNEDSKTVKELRTFEKDVSTGLNRIVKVVEMHEAEIAQLLSERQGHEQLVQQLNKQVVALEAANAEKQRQTLSLEQQVAQLTDRCENAEIREKEFRRKAMSVISGIDYNVTRGSSTSTSHKKIGQTSSGFVGVVDTAGVRLPATGNSSSDALAGAVDDGEEIISAVHSSGQNAAPPMSPNVFISTGDLAGTTFAPGQGLTCTPEYLHQAMITYQARLADLKQAIEAANGDDADGESFVQLSQALKLYVEESRRTMLALTCTPPGSDLRQYDELQAKARQIQEETDRVIQATQAVALQTSLNGDEADQQRQQTLRILTNCQSTTGDIVSVVQQMLPKGSDINSEDLAALLAEEMGQMQAAVSSAVARLEDIQQKARASTNKEGWKVEVDDKILAACKMFAQAVQEVTEAAAALQYEIEAAEKGALSKGEFYQRNVRWAQSLISSAKEITQASFGFVKAADDAVLNYHGIEEVIVWTEEVSASTVRLAVSARVKAPRNSRALPDVMTGTRNIAKATAAVVLQIRQCLEIIKQQEYKDQEAFENYVESLDFYKTNREEMECRIKAKQLEAELDHEHCKLRQLRKHHATIVGRDDARSLASDKTTEFSRRPGAGKANSASALARQILLSGPNQVDTTEPIVDSSSGSKPTGIF